MLPTQTLYNICARGLGHLYDDPDVESFLTRFWHRECRDLTPVQRRNLLFPIYEAAWEKTETGLAEAWEAADPFDAFELMAISDRYFAVFKNLGEYLIRTNSGAPGAPSS